MLVYSSLTGAVRGIFDRGVVELAAGIFLIPLAAAFLVWSGHILSGKRIPWRDLIAFGVVGACLLAMYSIVASIWVPEMFESYAARYGVVGVVFALISSLFAAMVVITGSAAVGREVHDEMGRIRRGERPSEDEVRKQWDALISDARDRWAGAREWADRKRGRGGEEAVSPTPEVASVAEAAPGDEPQT